MKIPADGRLPRRVERFAIIVLAADILLPHHTGGRSLNWDFFHLQALQFTAAPCERR
jgi:hypothetical protein